MSEAAPGGGMHLSLSRDAKQGEKHPMFNSTRVERVGSPPVKL